MSGEHSCEPIRGRSLPDSAWQGQPFCPKCGQATYDWMGDDICPKCGCVSEEIDALPSRKNETQK